MLIKGRNSKLAPAIGLALCITALARAGESPRHNAVVEAVSRVMPGVVNIATKTRVQRVRYYYDWWRDNWAPYAQELPPQESAGSGVVVDASGYVLTNVHVVKDADEISVKINDKNGEPRIYQAEAIAGRMRLMTRCFSTPVRAWRLGQPRDPQFIKPPHRDGRQQTGHPGLAPDRCLHQSGKQRRPADQS